MSSEIVVHRNGRLSRGGVDLYCPASAKYEHLHEQLINVPNLLLYGRRGTGKSTAVRWELHRRAVRWPGYQYLVARRSMPELTKTHIRFLPKELESLDGEYMSVSGTAKYANGSEGRYSGFERVEDALKALGGEYDCILIEEGTLLPWELIVDLASNLRTVKSSGRTPQLIVCTNPFGQHALPIKRRWIDKDIRADEEPYNPDDWVAVRCDADDNPHLDFQSYDARLAGLSPQKRRSWLNGEWATSESAFFSFEPTRDEKDWHVVARCPMYDGHPLHAHPWIPVWRAIDWGFSDDPAVCLWIAVLPNGRAIVVKERTWRRTPAAEVAHEVIGNSAGMRIVGSICDPSMDNGRRLGAQSVAEIFELNGVPLQHGVNDRTLAGYAVNEYLNTTLADGLPKLQVWGEGAPRLVATFPEQRAHKQHADRLADGNDHYVLSLAYFCMSGIHGQAAPNKPSTVPRFLRPRADQYVLGSESVRKPHLR